MERSLRVLFLLLIAVGLSAEKRDDIKLPQQNRTVSPAFILDLHAGETQQVAETVSGNKSTQVEIFIRTVESQLQQILSLLFSEHPEAGTPLTHEIHR